VSSNAERGCLETLCRCFSHSDDVANKSACKHLGLWGTLIQLYSSHVFTGDRVSARLSCVTRSSAHAEAFSHLLSRRWDM
jgi:hypothetical protein